MPVFTRTHTVLDRFATIMSVMMVTILIVALSFQVWNLVKIDTSYIPEDLGPNVASNWRRWPPIGSSISCQSKLDHHSMKAINMSVDCWEVSGKRSVIWSCDHGPEVRDSSYGTWFLSDSWLALLNEENDLTEDSTWTSWPYNDFITTVPKLLLLLFKLWHQLVNKITSNNNQNSCNCKTLLKPKYRRLKRISQDHFFKINTLK